MIVAVALDLGTTTIKAGLLSQDGSLSAIIARPAPRIIADGGRYESDASAYAETADAVLEECLLHIDERPPLAQQDSQANAQEQTQQDDQIHTPPLAEE